MKRKKTEGELEGDLQIHHIMNAESPGRRVVSIHAHSYATVTNCNMATTQQVTEQILTWLNNSIVSGVLVVVGRNQVMNNLWKSLLLHFWDYWVAPTEVLIEISLLWKRAYTRMYVQRAASSAYSVSSCTKAGQLFGHDIASGREDFELICGFSCGAVLLWNLGHFHWRLNWKCLITNLIFCAAPIVSLVYWHYQDSAVWKHI